MKESVNKGKPADAKKQFEPELQRVRYTYRLYIWILYLIVAVSVLLLAYETYCRRYYPALSISFFMHSIGLIPEPPGELEPGKGFGHTIGYIGSAIMILALIYPLRKRSEWFARYATRKFWLDTHIFLGILGAVFITFHTTFKIGGLVSMSYWSMIVVIASGIIGRFLYIQIPRSIAGNELGVDELNERSRYLFEKIRSLHMDEIDFNSMTDYIAGSGMIRGKRPAAVLSSMILDNIMFRIRLAREKRALFKKVHLTRRVRSEVSQLLFNHSLIKRRIALLEKYQELLEYWRPTHVWLSMVMFFFMLLHVAIAFFFYVEN